MKIKYLAIVFTLFSFSCANAQSSQINQYVIGFYNLENLFDTINDPTKNDEEYLPNGAMHWNTMKYTNKLKNMAYAISKMPANLAILGVSEIENRAVLEDLVAQPSIKERHLQIVHYDGPDLRSVDVGLLYNPAVFKILHTSSHRIKTEIKNFITRDQLVVTGLLDGEEINVIVLHWPSKAGGEKRSIPRRRDAALTTKFLVDSLFAVNPKAKTFVMGDLNDDPIEPSLMVHLQARGEKRNTHPQELYNPYYEIFKQGIGSLGYNDQWNLFDQIIVSYDLLPKNLDDFQTLKFMKAEVFNKDFLKQETGKYRGYPKRTHSGGVWQNGYSDHFPSLVWIGKYAKQ
ncbi:MAG: endonuclease/exonuclease/phosphatase family protein [Prevotellaceae bacterium]|jgi:hypothetical protein|nr:endonuclease/exonuclease/phosphatase family protein [Prevotellaceae bacterium]